MYHDFYSVERFMRDHQRELLAAAADARRARAAGRARAARSVAETARSRALQRATVLVFALAGLGHGLVALGRRLEALAAPAVPRVRGVCEDQPTAAGC